MNYSTNQVRHLYVAKSFQASGDVAATDEAGKIAVKTDTAKNHMYFEYKGADNLMRSDLIDIKNILWANATDADSLSYKLKQATITLDSTVNGGVPAVGQDYILRLVFKQVFGMSDEDRYFKYGMVHSYAGMTASEFYKVLALSLAKNFSRELTPLVSIKLKTAAGSADVTATTKADSLIDTYTGVIITEEPQPWRLGVMAQVPVYFDVLPSTITVEGDERIWGTVTEDTDGVIANGKNIADLEYFCMGERGDIYRGVGYPNNITTTYLVDPSKKYSVIDLHYAYVGSNESVQKSEKTITIVVPKDTDNTTANSIINAINSATGLSIKTLP